MVLNKNDIFNIVDAFGFPKENFVLLMGAALVIHGVRDNANDVDVGCTAGLFNRIKDQGFQIQMSRSGCEKIAYKANVTLYKNWIPTSIVSINGVLVEALDSLIIDKQRFNRPKDIEDIRLIKAFLKQHKGGQA